MGTALRTIGHDNRLSLTDHLDELRTRLIICGVAFAACFALCLWQNNRILDYLNEPLAKATTSSQSGSGDALEQSSTWQRRMRVVLGDLQAVAGQAAGSSDPQLRRLAARLERSAAAAEVATPRSTPRRPVTL